MTWPGYPKRLDTLGALIDNGMTLSVYCAETGCGHSASLDLELLAARLGRGHGSMAADLLPHLTCARCGANVKRGGDVSLRLGWGFRHAPRGGEP